MSAYYNENDSFAAAWLRELIKAGLIADGEVDERSIADVTADDVRGFRQCHFFAGIGGWSYALRLAGWPDDRAVWTGSCPCQPFSSAGAQTGGHDPRDLWPVWFQLLKECRPVVVFGEQVEAAIGHGWLDRLCDDLEAEDYAVGACGLPGPCVGAFDIRQRLWFVAESNGMQSEQPTRARTGSNEAKGRRPCGEPSGSRDAGALADAERPERWPGVRSSDDERNGCDAGRPEAYGQSGTRRAVCDVADPDGERRTRERLLLRAETTGRHAGEVSQVAGSGAVGRLADLESRGLRIDGRPPGHAGHVDERESVDSVEHTERTRLERFSGNGDDGDESRRHAADAAGSTPETSDVGFWSACDWLPCADGKARPVEPGTFPLASGVPARVGRLRGYGNAIKPQVAQVFIEAYLAETRA